MKTGLMGSLLAFVFSTMALTPAMADTAMQFTCGDLNTVASVRISIDPAKGVGDFSGFTRTGLLTPNGEGAWVNPDVEFQFYPERLPPMMYIGVEQFECREALAGEQVPMVPADGGQPQPGAAASTPINLPGRSYGGKLREGPGTEYNSIGSLPEGMPLTILANTHVRFNDFDWFQVALSDGRTGYQWGGIICADNAPVEGAYLVCGQQAPQ